jgi:hypothetical protein
MLAEVLARLLLREWWRTAKAPRADSGKAVDSFPLLAAV